MPVPLPDASTVNLVPPDAAETEQLARACATAGAAPEGLTEIQRAVINATIESMSGFVLDVGELPPMGPDEFAEVMRPRNRAFRERMVQVMLLIELLLVPLPPEVSERVEDNILRVTRRIASGSLGLGVWRFYRARGFSFPGSPGSAPPALAQHDWIHVLADHGSTVESEIEVFGFISRANTDPEGFSLLAMVLGLFETGYLFNAANAFFEYGRGHMSRDVENMSVRLADAMARGASSKTPWEAGCISPFQYAHGQSVAAAAGEDYDSYGATPPDA